jgi:hypothetical protein
MAVITGWTAGASSLSRLSGSGGFTFTVTKSTVGAVVGFNNADLEVTPTEIDHGFSFASGAYSVVENGVIKYTGGSYAKDTPFHVVRVNGTVYYCVGDVETSLPSLPVNLPGALVYTSTKPSTNSVALDVSLYASGDQVSCAAMFEFDTNLTGVANISFRSMLVAATNTNSAHCTASFLPMTVEAESLPYASCAISMLPMQVAAGETGYALANLSFKPMTVEAIAVGFDVSYNGSLISFLPMQTVISEASIFANIESSVDIAFPPMVAYGYDVPVAWAYLNMIPPVMFATGEIVIHGPTFNVLLPAFTGAPENYIRDTAVITSRSDYSVNSDFRETAVITSSATSIVTVKRDLREKAKLADRDYATARSTHDVTETAVLDDQTTLYNYRTDVRETAPIISEATGVSISRRDVRETFKGRDKIDSASPYKVRDSAVLNDAVTLRARTVQDVREVAVLNDSYADVVSGVETVRDSAVLNDHATNISTTRIVVRERGFISDAVTLINQGEVWTANVKTWAMSRYENLPLESFNDSYALGEDGIFAPSGMYADGRFTTGITRLGDSIKKTVSNLYFYGERETPLEVEVTADVRGLRQTYSYTQMARSADDSRMVRCDLGKGFSSTNYQFTVSGSGAFTVEHIEPVIQAGSRRI